MINDVASRARRRIFRRTIPFLFVLFIIAFLDRVNVGYAKLTMAPELGFSNEVYGFGAGVFFIGYFLLEIPGTLIAERWSVRKWIARIMISWGILCILTGFIHNSTQFYWARFLLGAAEAGFFPGIIVYLSHWFRHEDRGKAVAMFMAAIPIANILGSPVSGWILGANWFGLSGWRWVFILEAVPALIFGVITIFYLTDWPREARWLPEDERQWIEGELEREKQAAKAARSHNALAAFKHPEVILLTLVYFFAVSCVYGFNFWMPTIIDRLSGYSKFVVTLISAIPYCAALASMLIMGWSSDRTRERKWHTALPLIAVAISMLLTIVTRDSLPLLVVVLSIAAAGLYGYLPSFWALSTSFLTESAAAVAIGTINSFGNLGGFAGPYMIGYVSPEGSSGITGMAYLSTAAMVAVLLLVSIRRRAPGQLAAA